MFFTMSSSTRTAHEPFVRVRLIRFADGTQTHPLETVKLRIDTTDVTQIPVNSIVSNRPKYPSYEQSKDCFYFETRTIPGRKVKIDVCVNVNKTDYSYTLTSAIEDLIRSADQTIREYRTTAKGRLWMSVELITSRDVRETQRAEQLTIQGHYGHEFLPKYFTTLPAFCSVCKKILWGFNTPGYRCQLCDLVVHELCIKQVAACKQLSVSVSRTMPVTPHRFQHEPNFLPVFCDHDGKMIRPLRAWKCTECRMIVHGKCQSKVAHFCGTRQMAVKMYDEWKQQNPANSIETYVVRDEGLTEEIDEKNQKVLINIYERLQGEQERHAALQDLAIITKPYEWSNHATANASSYYNRSVILLHSLVFQAAIGRGMSASVYSVRHCRRDYALKALRKHRIFEGNDFEGVKNERNLLIMCRTQPFIIQLYAVFHDFERVYFLLEYAPCGAFYDFLIRFGSKFDNQCIQWFSGQIVCALDYLHSQLIIHRDLKPENVLLMRDGRLKLADFGFCKQLATRESVTRTFCGTPEYIAPEIYQKLNYSFPVDCWSLGVMIYEMVALKTPFYHPTEIEIRTRVISGVFQCPADISSDLKALLIGLLTKNPVERLRIDQLRSHSFYSAPYTLEDIQQLRVKCPWRQPIPLYVGHGKYDESSAVRLSDIDAQAICATHTVNKDKFRQFSFTAF